MSSKKNTKDIKKIIDRQKRLAATSVRIENEEDFQSLKKRLVKKSYNLFSKENWFRDKFLRISTNNLFILFINVTVFISSIFLALETSDDPNILKISNIFSYVFLGIYLLEFIFKSIAYGFVNGDETYLRDSWNVLDFLVIISGLISLFPAIENNLYFLRVLKIVRPLKALSAIPKMKGFISSLLISLMDLFIVFIILLFFFIIFALIGLSLWTDIFDYRCRTSPVPINGTLPLDSNFKYLCGGADFCNNNENLCLSSKDFWDNNVYFLNQKDKNANFYNELYTPDLNYGLTTFRNFFNALYIVFQSTTLEGWSSIMYIVMSAHGRVFAPIYFIIMIIFNNFFLLNLLVAILLFNFEKNFKLIEKEENLAFKLETPSLKENKNIENEENYDNQDASIKRLNSNNNRNTLVFNSNYNLKDENKNNYFDTSYRNSCSNINNKQNKKSNIKENYGDLYRDSKFENEDRFKSQYPNNNFSASNFNNSHNIIDEERLNSEVENKTSKKLFDKAEFKNNEMIENIRNNKLNTNFTRASSINMKDSNKLNSLMTLTNKIIFKKAITRSNKKSNSPSVIERINPIVPDKMNFITSNEDDLSVIDSCNITPEEINIDNVSFYNKSSLFNKSIYNSSFDLERNKSKISELINSYNEKNILEDRNDIKYSNNLVPEINDSLTNKNLQNNRILHKIKNENENYNSSCYKSVVPDKDNGFWDYFELNSKDELKHQKSNKSDNYINTNSAFFNLEKINNYNPSSDKQNNNKGDTININDKNINNFKSDITFFDRNISSNFLLKQDNPQNANLDNSFENQEKITNNKNHINDNFHLAISNPRKSFRKSSKSFMVHKSDNNKMMLSSNLMISPQRHFSSLQNFSINMGSNLKNNQKSSIKYPETKISGKEYEDMIKKYQKKYTKIKDFGEYKMESLPGENNFLNSIKETTFFINFRRTKMFHRNNKFAFFCYYIINQPIVQYFLYFCIIFNFIILVLERKGQSQVEVDSIEILNKILVAVFTIECLFMIFSNGILRYFINVGNAVDFMLVVFSLIEIIFINEQMSNKGNTSVASSFRILRILRILKLIRSWHDFRIMILSIINTGKRMGNYFILLIIFIYVYALIGCNLFKGSLKFNEETNKYDKDGVQLFDNFDSFGKACLSVFYLIIGDGWYSTFFDCYRSDANEPYVTIVYFISLILLGNLAMLNIFMAYLIDNFKVARSDLFKNIEIKKKIFMTFPKIGLVKHRTEMITYHQKSKFKSPFLELVEFFANKIKNNDDSIIKSKINFEAKIKINFRNERISNQTYIRRKRKNKNEKEKKFDKSEDFELLYKMDAFPIEMINDPTIDLDFYVGEIQMWKKDQLYKMIYDNMKIKYDENAEFNVKNQIDDKDIFASMTGVHGIIKKKSFIKIFKKDSSDESVENCNIANNQFNKFNINRLLNKNPIYENDFNKNNLNRYNKFEININYQNDIKNDDRTIEKRTFANFSKKNENELIILNSEEINNINLEENVNGLNDNQEEITLIEKYNNQDISSLSNSKYIKPIECSSLFNEIRSFSNNIIMKGDDFNEGENSHKETLEDNIIFIEKDDKRFKNLKNKGRKLLIPLKDLIKKNKLNLEMNNSNSKKSHSLSSPSINKNEISNSDLKENNQRRFTSTDKDWDLKNNISEENFHKINTKIYEIKSFFSEKKKSISFSKDFEKENESSPNLKSSLKRANSLNIDINYKNSNANYIENYFKDLDHKYSRFNEVSKDDQIQIEFNDAENQSELKSIISNENKKDNLRNKIKINGVQVFLKKRNTDNENAKDFIFNRLNFFKNETLNKEVYRQKNFNLRKVKTCTTRPDSNYFNIENNYGFQKVITINHFSSWSPSRNSENQKNSDTSQRLKNDYQKNKIAESIDVNINLENISAFSFDKKFTLTNSYFQKFNHTKKKSILDKQFFNKLLLSDSAEKDFSNNKKTRQTSVDYVLIDNKSSSFDKSAKNSIKKDKKQPNLNKNLSKKISVSEQIIGNHLRKEKLILNNINNNNSDNSFDSEYSFKLIKNKVNNFIINKEIYSLENLKNIDFIRENKDKINEILYLYLNQITSNIIKPIEKTPYNQINESQINSNDKKHYIDFNIIIDKYPRKMLGKCNCNNLLNILYLKQDFNLNDKFFDEYFLNEKKILEKIDSIFLVQNDDNNQIKEINYNLENLSFRKNNKSEKDLIQIKLEKNRGEVNSSEIQVYNIKNGNNNSKRCLIISKDDSKTKIGKNERKYLLFEEEVNFDAIDFSEENKNNENSLYKKDSLSKYKLNSNRNLIKVPVNQNGNQLKKISENDLKNIEENNLSKYENFKRLNVDQYLKQNLDFKKSLYNKEENYNDNTLNLFDNEDNQINNKFLNINNKIDPINYVTTSKYEDEEFELRNFFNEEKNYLIEELEKTEFFYNLENPYQLEFYLKRKNTYYKINLKALFNEIKVEKKKIRDRMTIFDLIKPQNLGNDILNQIHEKIEEMKEKLINKSKNYFEQCQMENQDNISIKNEIENNNPDNRLQTFQTNGTRANKFHYIFINNPAIEDDVKEKFLGIFYIFNAKSWEVQNTEYHRKLNRHNKSKGFMERLKAKIKERSFQRIEILESFSYSIFYKIKIYIMNSSMGIFHKNSSFRQLCVRIVLNKWFEYIIMFFILLNCVFLIMDNPWNDPEGGVAKSIIYANTIFTFIFLTESLLKIIAFGMIFGQKQVHEKFNEKQLIDTAEKKELNNNNNLNKDQNLNRRTTQKRSVFLNNSKTKKANLIRSRTKNNIESNINKITKDIEDPSLNLNLKGKLNPDLDILNEKKNASDLINEEEKDLSLNFKNEKLKRTHTIAIPIDNTFNDKNILNINNKEKEKKDMLKQLLKKETFNTSDLSASLNDSDNLITNNLNDQHDLSKYYGYLINLSNLIDFFVVIIGVIDVISTENIAAAKYLRTMRMLRSIRPIRIITKNENLKLIISCLIKSIPAIGNVLVVGLLFILIYALIGVNLFKNTMDFFCTNNKIAEEKLCIDSGENWYQNNNNFNNLLQALKTLFAMLTTENWVMFMNLSYFKSLNFSVYIYYISFIIFGNMFILNLFVTVIVENFKSLKERKNKLFSLTEEEKDWIKVQKIMLKFNPKIKLNEDDSSYWQIRVYKLINSIKFEIVSISFIFFAIIVLAIQYNGSDSNFDAILEYANYIVTFFFNLELILKIFVFRRKFFISRWNIFDFIVIALSNGVVILNILERFHIITNNSKISTLPGIFRALRILRVLRVIAVYPSLRSLIDTLVYLVPSIINIGLIMIILFTIYGCVGVNLFGTAPYRDAIHQYNNFRSFPSAILLLFRVTTGDNWSDIMNELSFQDCRRDEDFYRDLGLNQSMINLINENFNRINFGEIYYRNNENFYVKSHYVSKEDIDFRSHLSYRKDIENLDKEIFRNSTSILNSNKKILSSKRINEIKNEKFKRRINKFTTMNIKSKSNISYIHNFNQIQIYNESIKDIKDEISIKNFRQLQDQNTNLQSQTLESLLDPSIYNQIKEFKDSKKTNFYCQAFSKTICQNSDFISYANLTADLGYSCGNDFSYFYFISFIIIGPIFVMNLCVVMVVEGFSESMYENESLLSQNEMDKFISIWLNYDMNFNKTVKPFEMVLILKEIEPPLGFNYDRLLIHNVHKAWKSAKVKNKIEKNLINNCNQYLELKMTKSFERILHKKATIANENQVKSEVNNIITRLKTKKSLNKKELNKDSFKVLKKGQHSLYCKNFYFDNSLRFWTYNSEIIKILDFLGFNSNLSKKNECKTFGIKDEIITNGLQNKDLYDNLNIHFVDACLCLSRYITSKKHSILQENLREKVVEKFTTKMWKKKFKLKSEDLIKGNKNLMSENISLRLLTKIKPKLTRMLQQARKNIFLRKLYNEDDKDLLDQSK